MEHLLNTIQVEMKQLITQIGRWTKRNVFRFSTTNTKALHFTSIQGIHFNMPQLYIGNNLIPYTESIKFLGLTWDSKLLCREHINLLKVGCNKALGVLRTVTCLKSGGDHYCAIKIYRMYIRAKLDNGASICISIINSTKLSEHNRHTEVIRIATEAYKSTPT